ncbi:hypothetical protein HDU83_006935 [Entophlyctis luteolus]|nr:hypothetical protein HDU83_006935 [Entophlyctis luteolus]
MGDVSFANPDDAKIAANEKYKAGNYKAAVELYSKAIELAPENATYLANRSAAYTMLRNHALAVRDCRASLALDPAQLKVRLRLAKALVFLGELSSAATALKESPDPLDSAVVKLISEITQMETLVAAATKSLEEATVSFPVLEAPAAKALDAIERAIVLADPSNALLKQSPASPSKLVSADLGNISHKWLLLRAECLIALLDMAEAAKTVSNHVLGSDATNSEALTLRATILYMNDSHPLPHVLQILGNSLAYDPDNNRARLFLKKVKALEAVKKEGNDAYAAANWDLAETKYSQWLDDDNIGGVTRVKILSNRAMVRSKVAKHAKCISDCKVALDLLTRLSFPRSASSASEPSNSDIAASVQSSLFLKLHLRRADSLLKQENYEEAVRDYQVASEIKPQDREIANALARAKKAEKTAKRKDYYKILGIDRSADEGAIKKAYRKLALQYHPDKQASLPEEERASCDSKFKEISEAYSVLSDPRKKEMFDSGMDVDGSSASAGQGGFGGNPFGGGGGENMEDILRMFMGAQQQRGFGGRSQGQHFHFG